MTNCDFRYTGSFLGIGYVYRCALQDCAKCQQASYPSFDNLLMGCVGDLRQETPCDTGLRCSGLEDIDFVNRARAFAESMRKAA